MIGAVIVFWKFPKAERERQLLAEYRAEDAPPVSGGAGSVSA